jgi:integrase
MFRLADQTIVLGKTADDFRHVRLNSSGDEVGYLQIHQSPKKRPQDLWLWSKSVILILFSLGTKANDLKAGFVSGAKKGVKPGKFPRSFPLPSKPTDFHGLFPGGFSPSFPHRGGRIHVRCLKKEKQKQRGKFPGPLSTPTLWGFLIAINAGIAESNFLRCSRSHLSNAIHGKLNGTPRLPCVRIGRRVLFRFEALEEWLRQIQTNSDSSFHHLVRHPRWYYPCRTRKHCQRRRKGSPCVESDFKSAAFEKWSVAGNGYGLANITKMAQGGREFLAVVDHLRWDLNAIFKMASDDAILHGNPAGSLVTPKGEAPPTKRSLTIEEIQTALSALELRERIIFLLGVLVGMRPGEILALRWGSTGEGRLQIAERVYRGVRGNPKTRRSLREAAIPPGLAMDIERWRALSNDTSPDALVFPSERGTFLSHDNFLRRNFHNKLNKVGLGWITFQVLRRTQASLSHKEGIDPKISADQRGHGIGVALDTYTITDLASRRNAVTVLETALAKNARPQQTGFSR